MVDIVFAVLAILAIGGGFGMILFAQPIYSAISLIISFVALAGVFALLSAPFLFMVQIIIYAGAIVTLLIFIIMFLNVKKENLPDEPNKVTTMFVVGALLLPFNILILKAFNTLPEKPMHILGKDFGDIHSFGMELFRGWLVPFELVSMLLVVALIGSVVYVRKEIPHG